MKKNIFFALFSAMLLLTACQQHEIDRPANLGDGFTLVGHTATQTKTAFSDPTGNTIPFLWSINDKVIVNGQESEPLSTGGATAQFTFSKGNVEAGNPVYYGAVVSGANIYANVKGTQTGRPEDLGLNGDFGYATVEANNTFTLNHATSYLWLDPYSNNQNIKDKKVKEVSITATSNIYGMVPFDGSSVQDDNDKVFKTITIDFSSPKAIPSASSSEEIWAVAVTYPITTGTLNITYLFEDGNGVEVCRASYNYPSKTLEAGCTYRISQEIKAEDLYTLRTLTFEDADAKFEHYECTFNYAMGFYEETKFVEKWSDYIPTDTRYGNGHSSYEWYDENNTELAFVKPTIPSWWGISGHAGISNYVGNDIKAEGDEPSNLYMRDLEAFNVTGGANGSKNFCTQYGYLDPDEYATIYSPEGVLPGIQFYDEQPRVIDHMYVTNTTYAYAVLISGECDFGGSYQYTDESTFKIVAYGYESFEDTEPTSTEFYLLNTGKRMITDWTKWDLSVLGEVVRVEFNLVACDNGYGIYGNVIPAYFAYDDVAVRFPLE